MANAVQITSIIVFFGISIVGTLLPLFFSKKIELLSYLNIFAAGVFLAIGLMSILPESAEHLHEASEDFHEFPLAYFLTIVGFFIIFACEEVAHSMYRKAFGRSSHDEERGERIEEGDRTPNTAEYSAAIDPAVIKAAAEEKREREASLLAAIVLLVALSVHEILEGFSIGAMGDDATWGLFFAIVFHKTVESIALGAAFVRAQTKRTIFFAIIFVYALTLPLGIGLGLVTSAEGNVGTGVVLALSAGSFLYIATVEIIPTEFQSKYQVKRWLRYAALIGGTIIMSVLILLEEIAEHAAEGEEAEEEES